MLDRGEGGAGANGQSQNFRPFQQTEVNGSFQLHPFLSSIEYFIWDLVRPYILSGRSERNTASGITFVIMFKEIVSLTTVDYYYYY